MGFEIWGRPQYWWLGRFSQGYSLSVLWRSTTQQGRDVTKKPNLCRILWHFFIIWCNVQFQENPTVLSSNFPMALSILGYLGIGIPRMGSYKTENDQQDCGFLCLKLSWPIPMLLIIGCTPHTHTQVDYSTSHVICTSWAFLSRRFSAAHVAVYDVWSGVTTGHAVTATWAMDAMMASWSHQHRHCCPDRASHRNTPRDLVASAAWAEFSFCIICANQIVNHTHLFPIVSIGFILELKNNDTD